MSGAEPTIHMSTEILNFLTPLLVGFLGRYGHNPYQSGIKISRGRYVGVKACTRQMTVATLCVEEIDQRHLGRIRSEGAPVTPSRSVKSNTGADMPTCDAESTLT